MSNETLVSEAEAQVLQVEDLAIEELGEVAGGSGCASTVGTVSTPASLGTAATLG